MAELMSLNGNFMVISAAFILPRPVIAAAMLHLYDTTALGLR